MSQLSLPSRDTAISVHRSPQGAVSQQMIRCGAVIPFLRMVSGMEGLPDPSSFGALFEDFMRAMTASAERPEPEIALRVREHLGAEPKELPTTTAEFPVTER